MSTTAYIGSDLQPVQIVPSAGRTDFQTKYIQEIASHPDTAFLCNHSMCDTPYRGPFMLPFYSKSGKLTVHNVGQRRLLGVLQA